MSETQWIDQWVRRLNALGAEMDAVAASLHPSAWEEALAPLRAQYRKLAAQHYPRPGGTRPHQPGLFESEEPI